MFLGFLYVFLEHVLTTPRSVNSLAVPVAKPLVLKRLVPLTVRLFTDWGVDCCQYILLSPGPCSRRTPSRMSRSSKDPIDLGDLMPPMAARHVGVACVYTVGGTSSPANPTQERGFDACYKTSGSQLPL